LERHRLGTSGSARPIRQRIGGRFWNFRSSFRRSPEEQSTERHHVRSVVTACQYRLSLRGHAAKGFAGYGGDWKFVRDYGGMCEGTGHSQDGHSEENETEAAMPRAIAGDAVDPIVLEQVDEVVITTLVDNSYDGLMADMGPARRVPMARTPRVPAPQFERGETVPGLVAEHGFAAIVTTRRGERRHTLLFDTGVSPNGLADNMERLGIRADDLEAVVLSHGHFDHAGGIPGLARLRRRSGLPIVLHPLVWTARRVAVPHEPEWELPVLGRRAIADEGFDVVERRQPSLLLDGSVLITGEVDRTTDFETGMPFHQARGRHGWEPDPLILDDQALVVRVRGKGLVVLTGCGHAGAVNICRYALRLTGVSSLTGLVGGLHLTGTAFEPIIDPTVAALRDVAPEVVVPAHCTGWRAQHRLAAALPDAFVPNAVGTSITITAA
jgi:7,8-dihydropterin-6-yl-methyl-4-(beta-D-ribofuranosyl)aminobenzene 5'-phosphate synthase